MFARFIHMYPGYTLNDVMKMPSSHFFLLNRKIPSIKKEEEIQGLAIVHNSKPGDRVRDLVDELKSTKKIKTSRSVVQTLLDTNTAGIVPKEKLEAERARQKAAAAEIAKDRAGWFAKIRQQYEEQQANQQTE